MVPMRGVFETLGATIRWDQKSQTVTGTKGSAIIKMTVGSKTAYVSGKKVTLSTSAMGITTELNSSNKDGEDEAYRRV